MAAVPEVLQQQDEDRSKVRPYTCRRPAGGPPASRGPTFLPSSPGGFGAVRVPTRDAPAGPRAPFVLPEAEDRRGAVPSGPVSGAERARRASGAPGMGFYVKFLKTDLNMQLNASKLRPPPW